MAMQKRIIMPFKQQRPSSVCTSVQYCLGLHFPLTELLDSVEIEDWEYPDQMV